MRIPALFAVGVLLSTTSVDAQDLQFRTVTTSEALGLSLPGFTMNVSIKGQLTRIDTDVAGMWFSSIVDYGAKKMLMINHEEMTYTERGGVRQADADAASRPARGSPAEMRATRETRQMSGLKVKRLLITSNVPTTPGAPEDGRRWVMLQELWVASDAKLGAAFRRYINAMAASGRANASGQLFADIPSGTFPVRITVVVIAARPDERIDVDAVLKGELTPGKIQMRMVMEASDIRTTEVEPALFVVPTGYVKSSK